jgi:hypothetical protein
LGSKAGKARQFSGKTCFPLVPNGQYGNAISIDAIAHHIAAAPEVDQPFPERIGHVFNVATYRRLALEHLDTLPDSLYRSSGGIWIFGSKEPIQALYVAQRYRRPP